MDVLPSLLSVLFILSMIFGAIAEGWRAYEGMKLRQANPNKFGPGLLEMVGQYSSCKKEGEQQSVTGKPIINTDHANVEDHLIGD